MNRGRGSGRRHTEREHMELREHIDDRSRGTWGSGIR